jgi:predicted unusual protein kinase regulating ubiquinone biosynthesis (AarF/ABC1/UbiB family)
MVAEISNAEEALEKEFESVKAASAVALELADALPKAAGSERLRKRDVVRNTWQRTKAMVGLGRAVKEASEELVSESCDVDEPEICTDEEEFKKATGRLSGLMGATVGGLLGRKGSDADALDAASDGDSMEAGWERKSKGSAFKRTTEVWGFFAKCALRVLKARKAKGTDEEVSAAKTDAAEFIRDGLFVLGPTFVKLGQVVSTRTDLVEKEYIDVLKDLQDNVPGFGGERAVEIIQKELGQPIGQLFDSFDRIPIAAASLGQVHRAVYKGMPVAVKVQRAGLKELFDTDLKNLKLLAKLLDKFDPKSDGADRSYADIYDESAKLLYEEIDYTLEGQNGARFKREFDAIGVDYIKVPDVIWDATNERVLTMEYVESFKLTDIARVEAEGLDKQVLAQRVADSFLAQILKTSYFHCDPHPGNLCVNSAGQLVFYDCGMMNQLSSGVAAGFKEACFAIFGGGPFISEIQLDAAGKRLVDALEQMGVLAKGADRLSVEKLARFFIRSFKNVQQGKKVGDIKATLGADLKALTDQQVFRFPSTFTFIFRAFASIDGIGKGLIKEDFDLTKYAQPFVEDLTGAAEGNELQKWTGRLSKVTGLNVEDLDTAITQPKKVAYLEQTLRAMEQGNLKIRVRSLENENAIARVALTQQITNKLLIASILANFGLQSTGPVGRLWLLGSAAFGAQAGFGALGVKLFDKKNAKYENKDFGDAAKADDEPKGKAEEVA